MSIATTKRRAAVRPSLPKPHRPAVEAKPVRGLCSTCNHVRNCSYVKNSDQPVLFCEEFDCYTPPVVEVQPTEVQSPTLEEMNEWDKYKGLCVNCDNRDNCAIRDVDTGVWHCEEYQ